MKRSQVLFQQHVGRMFRAHWKLQGKKVLMDDGALKELKSKGIPYEDANEVVREHKIKTKFELDISQHFPPKPIQLDENHPDYHEEPCLKYSDNNVLLGGLDQAKVFTNSCEMDLDTLPLLESIKRSPDSPHDNLVKKCIKSSLLYDATQEKLPKIKDPERPAFNFARVYGITDKRKNFLLGKRLVQLCSSLSPQLLDHRTLVPGPIYFQAGLQRNEKRILLCNMADVLVTSSEKTKPIIDSKVTQDMPVPNIYPLSQHVSLEAHHFYQFKDIFPINEDFEKSNVHTVVIHFNKTEVANLYDIEVSESQFLARSLMKCYTFALAQARHTYGEGVLDLPEPIVVQCVQMDSKIFHFSILQLNTTAGPEETTIRNAYWNLPSISLYDTCDYIDGKPELQGYNPLVFRTLFSFFQNS
uniref:Large ribosomal subunit protein mL37 n=1 Tax=Panstrongylus megistus TaxID=65343 RepID=A0A069DYX5_9HEMI